MKIKSIAIFALFAFCVCLPLRAEEDAVKTQTPTPTPIRVLYSKKVPAIVRARVPRGGVSKFFGVCKFKTSGPEVLFHLYSTATTHVAKDENDSDTTLYVVDVFERNSHKSKARLINSIRFDNEFDDFGQVSADILWVDPKKKTIPIFHLDLAVPDGFNGPFGSELLVNFTKGLKGKATVQEFRYGGNSYGQSEMHSFYSLDANGLMVIGNGHRQSVEDTPEADNSYHESTCDWSGDRFCAPDATTIERK